MILKTGTTCINLSFKHNKLKRNLEVALTIICNMTNEFWRNDLVELFLSFKPTLCVRRGRLSNMDALIHLVDSNSSNTLMVNNFLQIKMFGVSSCARIRNQ
jgi:hypothetical protein